MQCNDLVSVGSYIAEFNEATDQSIPCCTIYQSVGLEKHILKRHPFEVENLKHVPNIIKHPDYIGKKPKENNSIELVKRIGENIQVCIKLDSSENYVYVASVYTISDGKLKNRLNSGRLKIFR